MPATTSCPTQTAVEVMGGKWKPAILYRLQKGTFRFGVLRRQMPWIGERVLIRQLKEMEVDGLVVRIDHREMPPRVDYTLSDYGRTLVPILDAMAGWGKAHLARTGDEPLAECG